MRRAQSIVTRIVALHIVVIAAASLLIPLAVYWLIDQAANTLHRDALRAHAVSLSSYVRAQPDGKLTLNLSDEFEPLYAVGIYSYAILDTDGKVLLSSRPDRRALFAIDEEAPHDWFERRLSTGSVMFGVSLPRSIGDRIYWIQVGQDLALRDAIIDDVVASFFPRVAWITFPILVLLLVIDFLFVRRVLAPVRAASTTASAISPTRIDVRLSEAGMPSEILPMVQAINLALDRLESGFHAQREFTADMAHELRTPLAIVRARVDSLEPGPVRDALRSDLINMTRTVNQVLDVAELESFIVDEQARADIYEVCADAVSFMAPLAIDQGKTVSLTGAPGPVWVHGHSEALFRAVRNLIENAIRHTPEGVAIEVEVGADGAVRVLDDGPGVPAADRASIFRRFWRRERDRSGGRGLGLAIVARVAAAHAGSVSVDDRPGGGAVFTLKLRSA